MHTNATMKFLEDGDFGFLSSKARHDLTKGYRSKKKISVKKSKALRYDAELLDLATTNVGNDLKPAANKNDSSHKKPPKHKTIYPIPVRIY